MKKPDRNTFNDAQKYILQLMAEDSYPKFLASDRYKQLMGKRNLA